VTLALFDWKSIVTSLSWYLIHTAVLEITAIYIGVCCEVRALYSKLAAKHSTVNEIGAIRLAKLVLTKELAPDL
jgi:hypothetical protein